VRLERPPERALREIATIHETDTPKLLASGGALGIGTETEGHSEHHATESAVTAAEIEQFLDRAGFLKFATRSLSMRVSFPVYEILRVASPYKPIQ
jgi:hypothetical protein